MGAILPFLFVPKNVGAFGGRLPSETIVHFLCLFFLLLQSNALHVVKKDKKKIFNDQCWFEVLLDVDK